MKRTGFSKPTYEQAIAKKREATERAVARKKERTSQSTTKPRKTAGNRQILTKNHKSKSISYYKKKLDSVFSIYIRLIHSHNGKCSCYTCGKVLPIKKIQNGHFVSRQYLATRWDENNCRPQCWGCNGYGLGKPLDFEERLKKELGNSVVERMKAKRHEIWKLDAAWYLEKIEHYKTLVKELSTDLY